MVKKTGKLKSYQKKILNHYFNILKQEININNILLFGSYAYGKPNKHSDIDLAIISSDFKNKNFDERAEWLSIKRDKLTFALAMDIFGYTPQEFKNIEKHSAIMAKAKRDGVWLVVE